MVFDMNYVVIYGLAGILGALPLAAGALQNNVAPPLQTVTTPPLLLKNANGLAKYEPARGVYLGAALDFSKLPEAGDNVEKFASIMRDYETEIGREQAIYTQFFQFPDEEGNFLGWNSHPKGWATAQDFANGANSVGAAPILTLEPMKPRLFVDGWQPGAPAYEATKAFAQGRRTVEQAAVYSLRARNERLLVSLERVER